MRFLFTDCIRDYSIILSCASNHLPYLRKKSEEFDNTDLINRLSTIIQDELFRSINNQENYCDHPGHVGTCRLYCDCGNCLNTKCTNDGTDY